MFPPRESQFWGSPKLGSSKTQQVRNLFLDTIMTSYECRDECRKGGSWAPWGPAASRWVPKLFGTTPHAALGAEWTRPHGAPTTRYTAWHLTTPPTPLLFVPTFPHSPHLLPSPSCIISCIENGIELVASYLIVIPPDPSCFGYDT